MRKDFSTSAIVRAPYEGDGAVARRREQVLFELAKRNKAVFRAHAGTPYDVEALGIGLFLAREITIRHGGAIWFESEEGRGSTFYMRLPRTEVP